MNMKTTLIITGIQIMEHLGVYPILLKTSKVKKSNLSKYESFGFNENELDLWKKFR